MQEIEYYGPGSLVKKSKVDRDLQSKKYKNIEWYRQIYRRKIWKNQTMWTGNYSWQSTKKSINVDWDLQSENTKKTNNVDRDLFVQKQEKIELKDLQTKAG